MTLLEHVVPQLKPLIRGVVHVGAHVANEAAVYEGIKDVLWVEANPNIFAQLQENVRPHGHRTALALLSDKAEWTEFNVMSGDGGCSSARKPTKHLEYYPDITVTRTFPILSTTIDKLLDERGSDANLLVIDTQGHELDVLRGAVNHIGQFDFVIAEAYPVAMYEGGATSGELCNVMLAGGYSAIMVQECDILFVKQSMVRVEG